MGEEAAGVNAVRIAVARINAGQSDIVLVGGSYNGERKDLLMQFEFNAALLRGGYAPVWERTGGGGLALGSLGAFLVIESRAHAEKRRTKILARISDVIADRRNRKKETVEATLRRMWHQIGPKLRRNQTAVLSGATGLEAATAAERRFLSEHADLPVRATGTYMGHALEPQFLMNVALAVIALGHGTLFPPRDASGFEQPMTGALKQVVVTSVGYWWGEGLALVEAA
jgi:3-oxoacyl-[acyl-carrier-protein] synthase II